MDPIKDQQLGSDPNFPQENAMLKTQARLILFRTYLALLLLSLHGLSHAAATITFSQVGDDVQAHLVGSLNITGLTSDVTTTPISRVRGSGLGTNVILGPTNPTSATSYITISGPFSIGNSPNNIDASSGSVNGPFGINMSASRLLVPQGFTGGAVSASATWTGASICSLGLTPGTYVYTWTGDSLTINVPSSGACAPIPTLSVWTQIMAALSMILALLWYRKQKG